MSDEEEWQAYLDAEAAKVDAARVSRQTLEQLLRECLRWDAGPGFPAGRIADALDRAKKEGARD